jgi:hypothetical protein
MERLNPVVLVNEVWPALAPAPVTTTITLVQHYHCAHLPEQNLATIHSKYECKRRNAPVQMLTSTLIRSDNRVDNSVESPTA